MIAGEWRLRLTMLEVRVLLKREPSTMVVAISLDQQVESDCTEWANLVHPVSCKLYLEVIVQLMGTCIASQAGCLVKGKHNARSLKHMENIVSESLSSRHRM